jgi:hypothetical protein
MRMRWHARGRPAVRLGIQWELANEGQGKRHRRGEVRQVKLYYTKQAEGKADRHGDGAGTLLYAFTRRQPRNDPPLLEHELHRPEQKKPSTAFSTFFLRGAQRTPRWGPLAGVVSTHETARNWSNEVEPETGDGGQARAVIDG